ncbi:MAG TPA: GNAT family protein [Actinomycetota bacterium]|jgi:RimJ/RimL family protein N-acetyltransferase
MAAPYTGHAPLEGSLVRLRAREPADASQLNDLFDDPDVLAGLQLAMPQSLAGFRDWMAATRRDDLEVFAIETLSERRAVGICGIESIDARVRGAEFGIWIGKPFWGRGYGTDATRTACRFGFRYINLQRIRLQVYATNEKAQRIYERVGFRREGVERCGTFLGGKYVDVIEMGMLAEELLEE